MNTKNPNIEKAVANLIESYEAGLALVRNIQVKCNEFTDVDFITRNLGIIRSNER